MIRTVPLAALMTALSLTPALASSDDAWAAFRAEVEAKCRALVEAPAGARVQIEVSPEGSSSYGAALVTVGDPAGGAERMVCIMGKQSKEAELSTPLPLSEGEGAAGGGMGQAQITGTTAGGATPPATEVVTPEDATAGSAAAVGGTAPPVKPGG